MKKRTQYIIFFVTFIPAILASLYVSFRLFDPYIGAVFSMIGYFNCFGMSDPDESCQYESVQIDCPSLSKKEQSGLATITISNPHDVEWEYGGSVYATFLEQDDKYNQEFVCSEELTIAPGQTGSFTCEVDPRTVEGEIILLKATASPEDMNCFGTVYATCGIQPYYELFCLIPFIVAIPFLVWFIIIASREESAEPIPEANLNDA